MMMEGMIYILFLIGRDPFRNRIAMAGFSLRMDDCVPGAKTICRTADFPKRIGYPRGAPRE
jgi:hypothetical protein